MELIAAKCKGNRDTAFYASCLNVTPRYLAVVTSRVAGKNPKQLIADYLILEIERTLLSSSKSIQEVSIEYGFSTQVAFTKFFKAHKGCSPSEFRNG
ncbi:MAG: helix-turn-helix domain-containing protein [Bacteroidales bacterium]|nr:helix-turn-helix domain-containing protein [Bacteroidales bacterium]